MKFACNSCRAQYMISDEKVGPAGVKVRCKRCGNVILVKRPEPDLEATQGPPAEPPEPEHEAPPAPRALDDEIGAALDNVLAPKAQPEPEEKQDEPPPDAGASASPDPSQVEWYVAEGEQQVGPLRFEEVRARWESSAIGPDTLAWRTGLPDWKPLSQIPELALRLAPRGGPAVTPGRGIPVIAAGRSAWDGPSAAAPSAPAASPAAPEEPEWKPSAASALASLVEQEMAAAKKPEPTPAKAAPAPETTNVRQLLGNLPEPPPAEPSRLIPVTDKSGPVHVERTRSRTGFWGSPSRGGLGRVAALSAGIAVGAILVVFVALYALGVVQLPGGGKQEVVAKAEPAPAPAPPPAPPPAPAPAPVAAAAPAPEAAAVAEPAPAAPEPAVAAVEKPAPEPPPAPPEEPRTPSRSTRTSSRTASRTARAEPARTSPSSSGSGLLDAGGNSALDAAFERELSGGKKGGGGTYIPPAPGTSSKPNKLGEGDIMAVVVGHKAAIKACAGKYRDAGGGSGTLVMRWTILPSGRTSNVAPKGPDHAVLASCIGKLIKDWRFPEYAGSTMAPIEFPFNF